MKSRFWRDFFIPLVNGILDGLKGLQKLGSFMYDSPKNNPGKQF
jgi:hypothetical protein